MSCLSIEKNKVWIINDMEWSWNLVWIWMTNCRQFVTWNFHENSCQIFLNHIQILIDARQGDILKVKVVNKVGPVEGITIHWHGLQQRGTQFSDGAEDVTQCTIPQNQSMHYKFELTQLGTYWSVLRSIPQLLLLLKITL